jgi:hypothetical protein
MDGETVLPLLMPLIEDTNPDVSKTAKRAVEQLGVKLHSKKANPS